MDITVTLDQLAAIQVIDDTIKALSEELEQLPKNLAAAKQDEAAVQEKYDHAKAELDAVMKKRKELEAEIAIADQNVIKYENDKLKVKTNEEFRAMNIQIDKEKERRSGIEDQVLMTYDDEETAQSLVDKFKGELDMVHKSVAEREIQVKKTAQEDEVRLKEFQAKREAKVAEMDPRMLARYEAVRKGKRGTAVVGIVKNACAGCHTAQPPQKINQVKLRDALLTCEFCGRFQVWNAEEPAAS